VVAPLILLEHAETGAFGIGWVLRRVVVRRFAFRKLFRREGNIEILVEVGSRRGDPLEAPPHPLSERGQIIEGGRRDACEAHIPMVQVAPSSVEVVRPKRAPRASLLPVR